MREFWLSHEACKRQNGMAPCTFITYKFIDRLKCCAMNKKRAGIDSSKDVLLAPDLGYGLDMFGME